MSHLATSWPLFEFKKHRGTLLAGAGGATERDADERGDKREHAGVCRDIP